MSTLYKKLIDKDTKAGKETAVFLETDRSRAAQLNGLRTAIFVLFLLSLAAMLGAGLLYRRLTEGQDEQKKIEARMVQLRDKAQTLENESRTYDQKIGVVRGDLDARTAEKLELEKQVKLLAAQVSEARGQAEQLKAERDEAEQKRQELEAKSQDLDQKSQDLREKLEAASPVMKTYVPETFPTVQEAPAVAAQSAKSQAEAALASHRKILTINRRFNFVVINLGLKDHLKIGDKLAVQRDGGDIGTVEIEKAYDHFAAATIIKETRKNPFKEGDGVRKL
jgi:hypothetical protein